MAKPYTCKTLSGKSGPQSKPIASTCKAFDILILLYAKSLESFEKSGLGPRPYVLKVWAHHIKVKAWPNF